MPIDAISYLWFWQQLWGAIKRCDQRVMFEFLNASIQVLFVLWMWFGTASLVRTYLLSIAPMPVWVTMGVGLATGHVLAIASHRIDFRAYALTATFVSWAWIALRVHRFGFTLLHVGCIPLAAFCLVAVFSLTYRLEGHHAGNE